MCRVCADPAREMIDTALRLGEPVTKVIRMLQEPSRKAVRRHVVHSGLELYRPLRSNASLKAHLRQMHLALESLYRAHAGRDTQGSRELALRCLRLRHRWEVEERKLRLRYSLCSCGQR